MCKHHSPVELVKGGLEGLGAITSIAWVSVKFPSLPMFAKFVIPQRQDRSVDVVELNCIRWVSLIADTDISAIIASRHHILGSNIKEIRVFNHDRVVRIPCHPVRPPQGCESNTCPRTLSAVQALCIGCCTVQNRPCKASL